MLEVKVIKLDEPFSSDCAIRDEVEQGKSYACLDIPQLLNLAEEIHEHGGEVEITLWSEVLNSRNECGFIHWARGKARPVDDRDNMPDAFGLSFAADDPF